MPNAQGPSFIWAPVIAFAIVGLLALVLRWAASGRKDSLLATRTKSGAVTDYGLLVPVATPVDLADGQRLTERLESMGIRSTLTTTHSGLRLMVFPSDAERARGALGGETA